MKEVCKRTLSLLLCIIVYPAFHGCRVLAASGGMRMPGTWGWAVNVEAAASTASVCGTANREEDSAIQLIASDVFEVICRWGPRGQVLPNSGLRKAVTLPDSSSWTNSEHQRLESCCIKVSSKAKGTR
jgi:hypothetical protein